MFLRPPDPVSAQATSGAAELQPVEEMDEYTGPTADQLRREAEAFKEQWESEKEQMISEARSEAERITNEGSRGCCGTDPASCGS